MKCGYVRIIIMKNVDNMGKIHSVLAKRLTFQARAGQLNTANQRYKCGRAKSNACLLCSEADGVFHSLGGCMHMKGMYITRHNEAVWIILRYLLVGRLGASVVMHDAGHRHDTAALQMLQTIDTCELLSPEELSIVRWRHGST